MLCFWFQNQLFTYHTHRSYKTENNDTSCMNSIQTTSILQIPDSLKSKKKRRLWHIFPRTTKASHVSQVFFHHLRPGPMMTLGTWGIVMSDGVGSFQQRYLFSSHPKTRSGNQSLWRWEKCPGGNYHSLFRSIYCIYIYCTLYIYLKYFATFPWWSLLPKRPTITAIVTASGMETAMLSFPGVLLQELCTALLFKSWKANIIQGPKPLLSRSNCRLCIFCCTPIIQLHTTANLALLFPSRFIISSFWRCQTLVALRFHFQLYRLWPICPPRRGQDVAASYAENVGCTLNSSTIKIDCPRSIWCCGKTLHLSSVSRNFMTSFHASSLFDYLWFRTFPLLSFTLCRLGELAKSYLSSHTHTCHGQKWL